MIIKMYQNYKIANLIVKMDTFGRNLDLALPYQIETDAKPDIIVEPDYRSLRAKFPQMPDDICEYLSCGKDFYRKLLDFDGMMLHAAAIAVDGRAYLFSADSGVGKSTHTQLWQKVLGKERVVVLNDDKPAMRMENGVWYAYGTPWSGKHGINQNLCYPLGGISFLERGETNKIEPYDGGEMVFQFLKQTYRYDNDLQVKLKILSHIDSLVRHVPVWRMQCNMEEEAANLSYKVMTRSESMSFT